MKKKNKLKLEDLDEDEDITQVICFNLIQIGELVKKFDEEFLNMYNRIPWKEIKGMRDIVVHGYGTISLDKVWTTARKDVPKLCSYCIKIINQNEKQK